jgi:hypothetical protein
MRLHGFRKLLALTLQCLMCGLRWRRRKAQQARATCFATRFHITDVPYFFSAGGHLKQEAIKSFEIGFALAPGDEAVAAGLVRAACLISHSGLKRNIDIGWIFQLQNRLSTLDWRDFDALSNMLIPTAAAAAKKIALTSLPVVSKKIESRAAMVLSTDVAVHAGESSSTIYYLRQMQHPL